MLAADLRLLDELDCQITHATDRLAALLPATPFAVLRCSPGWRTVRAAKYGAALGDPDRWRSAKATYRAAGLCPRIYESAGRRRDGSISREGSVTLRQALLDLGMGLWHHDPAAKAYAAALRARGRPGGIVWCALAIRAARIAYAMVRDQTRYAPPPGLLPPPARSPNPRPDHTAVANAKAARSRQAGQTPMWIWRTDPFGHAEVILVPGLPPTTQSPNNAR